MILGDQKLAINLLKSVVKKDTNHISAYLQLGNIFRSENNNQALKFIVHWPFGQTYLIFKESKSMRLWQKII